MRKEIKNSLKKWEDKISLNQLRCIFTIEIVLLPILLIKAMLLLVNNKIASIIIFIMFIILIFIVYYTALLGEKKEEQEKEKSCLQKFFNEKSKIEVRLIPNSLNQYPTKYYRKNDLENLVFLSVHTDMLGEKHLKFYAELRDDGQLYLSTILDEKDKLNDDQFYLSLLIADEKGKIYENKISYELLSECFYPVK